MNISFKRMTDPPSFTYNVTCTSTGGPATTSSFTRNGAQLGQLELVDRVSSEYRRVVVESGSEGVGDCYHCSASNARPSSANSTLCLVGELVQYHNLVMSHHQQFCWKWLQSSAAQSTVYWYCTVKCKVQFFLT